MQELVAPELRAVLERYRSQSVSFFNEPTFELAGVMVIDSTRLGPAAGGVRTHTYVDEVAALTDACRLAQAMTIKCAIAGLDAGGGKIVVWQVGTDKRAEAFQALGRRVEEAQGMLRTAGDLGTTAEDLANMAKETRYVHAETANLAQAVARGVVRCAEACADERGRPGISGLRVAIQGAGQIGAAVARAMHAAGAEVVIADVVDEKARALAKELGGESVSPDEILSSDVDLLSPCAIGDALTPEVARTLRAWAVVPGANAVCSERAVHQILHDRGVAMVPDLVSSSGAVIEGVGRTVMGLEDRTPLIDALGATARALLDDARRTGTPPFDHALERARARMRAAAR